jgi:cytosine/adenosine deaminase-related metal-dependent hydrolase
MMFRIRNFLTLIAALTLAGCGQNADSPKKALTGATLIDGSGGAPVPNAVVLVENDHVTVAGPAGSVPIPDGFAKTDLAGKFIVPGLIDVHVVADAAEMKAFLAAGITTIGADTPSTPGGPHVFPASTQQAGIADLVIASNGKDPAATFAKIDRMAKAEIAPLQIIRAATQNGAAWLQQPGMGAIETGRRADLLVLNADPIADIKNLRQIDRVMMDGHWVSLK